MDLLLDRSAPVSAKTRSGLTALHMATQGDHYDTARILLLHKALIDDVTLVPLTSLTYLLTYLLVHGQVTIIFVVSVCLFVCLCRVFLSRL